jgi:uncharacterized protein YgbK (DUF1537 family)
VSARWLIIADDLTGAADCAIAFAKHGLKTEVFWGQGGGEDADVLAVDADSRRFPPGAAAARQLAAQAARWRPDLRLYKKIDSTIRGQPAAELAAQLRAFAGCARAPLAVVAPAFPATGRFTRDGCVVVDDMPLESTPLWARDHTYASAFLPDVLGTAGLTADVIPLARVRAGRDAVLERMRAAERRGRDAVVCDSATEADLATVAAAALALEAAVWVGSAGLAAALAATLAPAAVASAPPIARPGAVLTVVGSLAESSRLQAKTLADSGLVVHLVVAPDTLLGGPSAPPWQDAAGTVAATLAAGRDLLIEVGLVDEPDLARGAAMAASLADLVAPAAACIGAVVATGGETACALLTRLGVHGIRLVDEVEPGVPLGVSIGARRMPVVTKAGAFGDAATLARCLARLKACPPSD